MDKTLKQKITERWNIITDHQTFNPMPSNHKTTAFAQLEYILIEAGLLAERRERKTRKEVAQHAN